MIKVGLTGNIGSGKSTVIQIFETLGVPVYHADLEAKKFLKKDHVKRLINDRFGTDVFSGGQINRKKLAAIVFNDSEALNFLNAVIHPLVKEDLNSWMIRKKHHAYVIQEAAILFESGFYKDFDKVILISCPEDVAAKRVMKRDGVTVEEVLQRRANQWSQDKKIGLSDYIIDNSGNTLVLPQVLEIHKQLIEK